MFRTAVLTMAAAFAAVAAAGRGHMERFGEHLPPESYVEELDTAELRARAAQGEMNALNPGFFLDRYVVHHKPVIFKGLARNWTFRQNILDDEWLVDTIGADTSTRVETKDDDKHNVPPNVPFQEFIESYEAENMYMVDETPPPLHKHIPMPEPLRCDKMSSKFFVTYFWMSTGETDSKMHIDTDENMMCVLHGTKRVLLVDPAYSQDVYADQSYSIGVSPVDTRRVNHTMHPRVANVPYLLAVVEAGDCFFLPQNYWHYVHSFGKRNQAVTMWWKSKPLVAPDRFTNTLQSLSFAQSLANYETYVQAVAPDTPSYMEDCAADAAASASLKGWIKGHRPPNNNNNNDEDEEDEEEEEQELGDKEAVRAGVRRWLLGEEDLHMSDFEFATDKEEGDFGEDTKGDRDEADWENPLQRALHLPDVLAHCHFNLTNPRNPCFVAGCASRDDTFGCLRYTLEYCRRVADYGCQDLVWTLNKRSGAEFEAVTVTLPDVFEVDVEDWPLLARNSDETGHDSGAEEFEEEQAARRERARMAAKQLSHEGGFLGSGVAGRDLLGGGVEDGLELSEWADLGMVEGEDGSEDDWMAAWDEDERGRDSDEDEVEPAVQADPETAAAVARMLGGREVQTGSNISSPLLADDKLLPHGLTRQEGHDHKALLRWMAANDLLLKGPPSRLARQLHEQLSTGEAAAAAVRSEL